MAQLQRIVRGRSATLTHTFYSDLTATDPVPDTTTVTITRADGTAVVTGASATEAGTGIVTYTVTPAQTALLDRWTVTWTATFGGQSQAFAETVEVAGDVLFNVSELGALKTGGSSTIGATYSVAEMGSARTYAETVLEDYCGQAFVPRYERQTFSGDDGGTVVLSGWPVRAIRSVTVTDSAGTQTAYTAGQLTLIRYGGGIVTNPTGWTAGYGNFTIGYEHGLDYPPPGASEAALILAKSHIVRGPIDDRATQQSSEYGPINIATPGMFGSETGLPYVDAFIRANRMPSLA